MKADAKKPRKPSGPAKAPEQRALIPNYSNVISALHADYLLHDLVSFDAFTLSVILEKPIPTPVGPPQLIFERRAWEDADDVALALYLQERADLPRVSKLTVRDAIVHEARERSFHPVADYLTSLEWDCLPRISNFLTTYCGAQHTADTKPYVEAISRAFFIGVVARIMAPGCKLDTMPVLEGEQGALKSQMLRTLAVSDDWFSDHLPHDLASKDAAQHTCGAWLIELSEISQLRRGDVETVKAFLSRQFDRYRPPYGRTTITVPRQCSFIGTTNSETYLKDATGNRRFWPVRLTKISLASIEADRDQIWAEAVAAYDSGEKWWLSPEIETIAAAEQSERLVVDPWTDDIAKYIAPKAGPFTTADILTRVIDKKKDRQDRADEMRVAEIFATLGLVRERRRVGGQRSYLYVKPKQPSLPEINEGEGRDSR